MVGGVTFTMGNLCSLCTYIRSCQNSRRNSCAKALAGNLYFSWQHEIEEFFAQIDRELWEKSEHNPVWFLNHLPQGTLEELAEDEFFLDRLSTIAAGFEKYVSKRGPMTGLDSSEEGPVVPLQRRIGLAQCLPFFRVAWAFWPATTSSRPAT
jgi:hypothetical protein